MRIYDKQNKVEFDRWGKRLEFYVRSGQQDGWTFALEAVRRFVDSEIRRIYARRHRRGILFLSLDGISITTLP